MDSEGNQEVRSSTESRISLSYLEPTSELL